MELPEGVAIPEPEPKEEPGKKKTPIKVRCIMLFDGTGNNKTNIESRLARNDSYQATRSKKYKLFGERVGPGDDSYENGFTNIVTLDKHIEAEPGNGYDLVLKIYTEGAGTIDNEGDAKLGYGMGIFAAGVKNKCEKGILASIQNIVGASIGGQDIDPETHYIQKLTIDVFGFSRGAATARYCIYKVLIDEQWQMSARLAAHGFLTEKVEVCFAGLFDTVASFGVPISSGGIGFGSGTHELELDAVKYATKVLHLTAAEEHRKNFSLTTIKSAGGKGEEYCLPGVHSDVGGSYLKFSTEDFYVNTGKPSDIQRDRQVLIEEGWYSEDELTIETIIDPESGIRTSRLKATRTLPFDTKSSYLPTTSAMDIEQERASLIAAGSYADEELTVETEYDPKTKKAVSSRLKVSRMGISNAYCNIPLKIMAKHTRAQNIKVQSKLEEYSNKAIAEADAHFGNSYLSTLDSEIASYMTTTIADFAKLVKTPLLKEIRHRYLHMSAKEKLGLKPRWKTDAAGEGLMRWRKVYDDT